MRFVRLPSTNDLYVNPEHVAVLQPDPYADGVVWLYPVGVGKGGWPIYLPIDEILELLQAEPG